MDISTQQLERRKYPRFSVRVPFNLHVPGPETEELLRATSINVSLNGVYCQVNRYLPVFDRILITFVIPENAENPGEFVLQCEGIVVRSEPEQEEPQRTEYNVAIYFQDLSQVERNVLYAIISSYIE